MNRRILIAVVCLVVVSGLGFVAYRVWWNATYRVIERTEYNIPPEDPEFVDDTLEDKNPVFDEVLVDSRPLGEWEVNKSAAVIKLDCPAIKPDREVMLLVLRPTYAAALEVAKNGNHEVLPSANLLDGAAKQFDDGLYAAIELAVFRGALGISPAVPEFLQAVFEAVPESSPARPFLAAAMELGGKQIELTGEEAAEKDLLLDAFERDRMMSRPIAFYRWTPELEQVWRCLRFLQREFGVQQLEVPRAVATVLQNDPKLLEQYGAITGLYAQLTNPAICLPVDALIGSNEDLSALAQRLGVQNTTVSILPPSTSRETELFNRLFAAQLPANANLMLTLIQRIRSGSVDLTPQTESGWYQYQVHALETLLLPARGQEAEKLLLTASYKKRLLDAFKALITKRRETHVRQAAGATDSEALGPGQVAPRLRVEPCVTYYLRTARAYAFLEDFLVATVGQERLATLYGLKADGLREVNLAKELADIRDRFYGFYLVSCEDIGLPPKFLEDEPVKPTQARAAALAWLDSIEENPDLAVDTRVSVPVFRSLTRNKTRLWATLGVRLARLDASYARAPRVRPLDGAENRAWRDADPWQLGTSHLVIPVDEFAEFELDGSNTLTRSEFRALCDQHETKEGLLEALLAK